MASQLRLKECRDDISGGVITTAAVQTEKKEKEKRIRRQKGKPLVCLLNSKTTLRLMHIPFLIVSSGSCGCGVPAGPCPTNPSMHLVHLRRGGTPQAPSREAVSPAWDDGCLGYIGSRMDNHQG